MTVNNISQLENYLGIQFNDPSLLISSLTHSSYTSETPNVSMNNERLEFLGDAVLDAAISHLIFNKYPDFTEGQLTIMRSKIVNGSALSQSAKRFGLGDYLLLGKGEDKNGGRTKTSILSSALEALLGAVFIDKGFNVTCDVILNILEYDIDNVVSETMKDPKTELQEIVQSQTGELPEYNVVSKTGEGHSTFFISEVIVNGEKYARGEGASKLVSEMEAATQALFKIRDTII